MEAPFLTLPTACTGPEQVAVEGRSWPTQTEPQGYPLLPAPQPTFLAAMQGCAQLPFSPQLALTPDTGSASSPAGLTARVTVPQQTTLEASHLAEATVRDTTVTLPEGMQLNPGAAVGLSACPAVAVGLLEGVAETLQVENDHFSPNPAACPDQSKVGTVRIKTPLLKNPLEGSVYLAEQDTNPFAPPLVLYLIARDPVSGVLVKLAGRVAPDPGTGRLTSTFEDTPPLPFEALELHFFGGNRASLSTPSLCGTYAGQASFTPWSGNLPATSSPSFQITTGSGGGPCPPSPLPFSPALNAGVSNPQAGVFSPFELTIGHRDGDQALGGLTVHLPAGAAALLSSVTPCGEPQAAENQCGPESLIGRSTASSGLGGDPYTLPGNVYLTGPYERAPFGLSVVTPAVAGPFNLGDVTVRSRINVDPSTARVTISSDPFPTIVKGVPVQLKQVHVDVDRPGFEFNPTSCSPLRIESTITGTNGGVAELSSPIQMQGCALLPFHPTLTASAGGHASKADGVSFTVRVTSSGLGNANIQKVDLQLPLALPSRLTTLQKACTAGTFEVNPASCSSESIIGMATIHTPVFKNPLAGPAYLVSHGNAQFPDVEFLLQGEGVTILLDGKTDIKKGITYSRFDSAPDAPFTSFETNLPAGPHSALTAHASNRQPYNLCGKKMEMPTEITAQDGAVIKQETTISLTGCATVKATRAQLLAKALKACRVKYNGKHKRKKRVACEHSARKRYATKSATHTARRLRSGRQRG